MKWKNGRPILLAMTSEFSAKESHQSFRIILHLRGDCGFIAAYKNNESME
jgi:hypothetical protein